MRGVFRSEPKFLAIFTNLDARRFSVRTKTPGGAPQFKCEAFCRQNRNSRQYLPIWMRGVFRSEPDLLAVFTNLNAKCLSVRTKIPGGMSQFQCEAFWVGTRIPGGAHQFGCEVFCRSGPNSLAVNTTLNARRSSVRTEIPGDIDQFKCEAFFGENRSPRRFSQFECGAFFRSEPKLPAVFNG